jgi:Ca2+-binding RTX toxin-like protein
MLATNTFSHVGAGGSNLGTRATSAGYSWSTVGENIAVWGTSGTVNLTAAIEAHHQGLFLSSGHRRNMMHEGFTEVGLAQEQGSFTFSGGSRLNASMLTEHFGTSGNKNFLTGVAFTDRNADSFYSVGEGRAEVSFTVAGSTDATEAAGGYAVATTALAKAAVSGKAGTMAFSATVDFSDGNVKLDLMNGNTFLTSGSIVLGAGVNHVSLLGIADLDATGNKASNLIRGNEGANQLRGGDGNDTIEGGVGNDVLRGHAGNDRLLGGAGQDTLVASTGNDYILGSAGTDRISGGTGADHFAFANRDGADVIGDFNMAERDRLLLNEDLWTGTRTASQVVSSFATVTSSGVVFNFGDGDTIRLASVTSLDGLAGAILFW